MRLVIVMLINHDYKVFSVVVGIFSPPYVCMYEFWFLGHFLWILSVCEMGTVLLTFSFNV